MIEVTGLSRHFEDIKAVDNISFSISDGEIIGFLGPNGAGKTTTLRMLTGYLQPTSGSISYNEKSIFEDPLGYAGCIGYLPEQNPLYDEMTVADYLHYVAGLRQMKFDYYNQRLDFVVRKCGLREVMAQTIQTLSKGYRQRVGLAQAIIHDPQVLIMDEPTSGLDPNQIIEIRDLIRELGESKTVILSSHIMQEVQAVCSRIIIINRGVIAADAAKEELYLHLSGNTVLHAEIEAESPDFSAWLADNPEVSLLSLAVDGGKVKVEFSVPPEGDCRRSLARYLAERQWLVLGMYEKQPTLEEIFHTLTLANTGESNAANPAEAVPVETTDKPEGENRDETGTDNPE